MIPIIKTDNPMSEFENTTIENNDEMRENNTITEKKEDFDKIPADENDFNENNGSSTETDVNHEENNDQMPETEDNSNDNTKNSTQIHDRSRKITDISETEENLDENSGNSTETNNSFVESTDQFPNSEENLNSGNSTQTNEDSEKMLPWGRAFNA
jgi:hypothetical protein